NIELTGNTNWNGIHVTVQDVDSCVGNGPANGLGSVRGPQRISRVRCIFRWTIEVVYTLCRGGFIDLLDQARAERFSGQIDGANGWRYPIKSHELGHGRRDRINERDFRSSG